MKCKALQELNRVEEAMDTLSKAPEKVQIDNEVQILLKELNNDLEIERKFLNDPKSELFIRFLKWLKDGGAFFDNLKIVQYSENFRGVHAKTNISPNEVILYVPNDLIITLEMAKATIIGTKMMLIWTKLNSPKHSFLASYLLQELKKPDSKWKPYFDTLPPSTRNFPVSFTDEEMDLLQGSPFYKQAKKKQSELKDDYALILSVAPEFNRFTLEEFRHIRMLVSSRIFGIEINNIATDTLVPLADMLNHSTNNQTHWGYNELNSGFVIESSTRVKRGNEIYDSYGNKCNSRFFLNYGFILEDNKNNEVPISIKSTDMNISTKVIRVREYLRGKSMVTFLGYLRTLFYDDDPNNIQMLQVEDLEESKNNYYSDFTGICFKPVSIKNEIKVLGKMKELAEDQLKLYPHTYEEDLELLKGKLKHNERNCILMRSGEKKILLSLISLANLGLKLAEMPINDAEEFFKKEEDNKSYEKYIKEVLFLLMKSSQTDMN